MIPKSRRVTFGIDGEFRGAAVVLQPRFDEVWPECLAGKSTFVGQNVILVSITGRFNKLGGGPR